MSLLFPDPPRSMPARVWVRIACRSAHILCIGAYVGGVLFDGPEPALRGWLHGAMLTGGLLIATDLHRSFIYLKEVRGLAMIGKLAALGASFALPDQRLALLVGIVVFSSVVSHMPSQLRHWTLGVGVPTRDQRQSGRG